MNTARVAVIMELGNFVQLFEQLLPFSENTNGKVEIYIIWFLFSLKSMNDITKVQPRIKRSNCSKRKNLLDIPDILRNTMQSRYKSASLSI